MILKELEKYLNKQGNNNNLLMKITMFTIIKKDVISKLNEEVDERSTSDKWWFDSCERNLHLAYSILENYCNNRYIGINYNGMSTTLMIFYA